MGIETANLKVILPPLDLLQVFHSLPKQNGDRSLSPAVNTLEKTTGGRGSTAAFQPDKFPKLSPLPIFILLDILQG